ncbi:Uncharacterised protein at_DN0645 [Pycnogonum litorale]
MHAFGYILLTVMVHFTKQKSHNSNIGMIMGNIDDLPRMVKDLISYANAGEVVVVSDTENVDANVNMVSKSFSSDNIWTYFVLYKKGMPLDDKLTRAYYGVRIIVLLTDSTKASNMMNEFINDHLFMSMTVWLHFTSHIRNSTVPFDLLNFTPTTKLLVVWKRQIDLRISRNYQISYVNRNYTLNKTTVNPLGKWTHRSGLKTNRKFSDCCYDMNGKRLTVVTVQVHSSILTSTVENSTIFLKGLFGDIYNVIQEKLGVKSEIYYVQDKLYGDYDAEIKLATGVVRDLYEKKADFAAVDFMMTWKRSRIIEFSPPVIENSITVIYKRHASRKSLFHTYLKPFHYQSWIAIACVTFMILLSLYVYKYFQKDEKSEYEEEALYLLSSLTQQSWPRPSRICSSVIIHMSVVIFGFLLYNFYSSKVVSLNTVNIANRPFTNLYELASSTQYYPGILDQSAQLATLKKSNDGEYKALWTRISKEKGSIVSTVNEGIKLVKTSNMAFMTDRLTLEYFASMDSSLEVMEADYMVTGSRFAWPKNSPYRTALREIIMKIRESGLVDRLKKKHIQVKRPPDVVTQYKFVDVETIFAPVIILTIGAGTSMFVLAVENIRKKYQLY